VSQSDPFYSHSTLKGSHSNYLLESLSRRYRSLQNYCNSSGNEEMDHSEHYKQSRSARISVDATVQMTSHQVVDVCPPKTTHRSVTWFRWVIALISISIELSEASKPRVTTISHPKAYDDLSTHKRDHKRWSALHNYDFPGLSQSQIPSNEPVECLTESSTETSDDFEDLSNRNRGNNHHVDSLYSDHSPDRSRHHKQMDTNVDARQVQKLLRLPCSLSLRIEAVKNSMEINVQETVSSTPVSTYIDTGATHTVLTYGAAMRAGIAHLIDTRYAGHASGVAGVTCRVLGRIPSHTVSLTFHLGDGKVVSLEQSPVIMVLQDISNPNQSDEDRVDMLIGLDLLEEWEATISLRNKDVRVRQRSNYRPSSFMSRGDEEIVIPFQGGHAHGNVLIGEEADSHKNHHHDRLGHYETASSFMGGPNKQLRAGHQQKMTKGLDRNMFTYDSDLTGGKSSNPETKNEILLKGSTTLSPGKEEDEVSDGYSDEGEFEDYGCDMSGV